MKITIVGLGAGDISQISFQAVEVLNQAKRVFLRTEKHPVLEKLDLEYESFDSYYDEGEKFEEVYDRIAKKVVELAKEGDLVYGVPGHPRVAESSVPLIEEYARQEGVEVEVVASMSFIDAMYNFLGFDPSEGFRLLDAFSIKKKDLDCDSNIIITQVYDRYIASNIKIGLMEYYEDEQEVYIVSSAGIKDQEFKKKIELCELDRSENEFDHLTSLFIPKSNIKRFKDVNDIQAILPDILDAEGEVEHSDLIKDMDEKVKSLKENIEKDDIDEMIKNLGGILVQVLAHSQIGIEEGYFDFEEVCDTAIEEIKNRKGLFLK